MFNKLKIRCIIILIVPITFFINLLLKHSPALVERYYSNGINKSMIEALSSITGIFSISVGEFLLVILLFILVLLVIMFIISIKKGGSLNAALNIISYAAILYIFFMFLWGFNYDRLPFDKIAGLKIEKSSSRELYILCDNLISKANAIRGSLRENSKGIVIMKGDYTNIFYREKKGYEKASRIFSVLSGNYGSPKPILLSEKMTYTGITGIYMPYTGEANVNINNVDFMLPVTAAHEMAHQRGFAREDEANYIAYLCCSMHPDLDFQYSGIMLALIHSMNALAKDDIKACRELSSKYSEGVRRDLMYNREFWSKYEGKIERISSKINNNYLKANGQKEGIKSYGRMVDLLLAEYRAKKGVMQQ
ncbi:MAG: DUF3810 domain-containing protein [Bacillota bacterium]|nr:DUF3810 domain-containing protein [Bacillota bacterium]